MPRRISTYTASTGWASLNFDSTVGAFVFGPAILLTLLNLILSYRKNDACESNPWEAKEMEWTGNYSGLTPEPQNVDITNAERIVTGSQSVPEKSEIPNNGDLI
jgi:heme/copper-type cytochrome/quinol oxidase subunit 1